MASQYLTEILLRHVLEGKKGKDRDRRRIMVGMVLLHSNFFNEVERTAMLDALEKERTSSKED